MADGISAVPAAQPRATGGRAAGPQGLGGTAAPARLSFGQERLWFMHQLFPKSFSYHVPIAFRLRGGLDLTALQNAFTRLLERHTVLRTRYRSDGDASVVPVVSCAKPFIVEITEVPTGTAEECRELVIERSQVPFDLDTGPVIRAD